MIDLALIERARQGDADAFGTIYATYYPAIRRHAGRLLGDVELAADVAQETFTRAYQHRVQLRPEPQLRAWLYRIASNACLDLLRRRRFSAPPPPPGAPDAPEPEGADFAPQWVEAEAVRQALATLRPSLRVPLVLFAGRGWSCKEIAAQLHCTPGTVGVRLYRARAQFALAYAGLGGRAA